MSFRVRSSHEGGRNCNKCSIRVLYRYFTWDWIDYNTGTVTLSHKYVNSVAVVVVIMHFYIKKVSTSYIPLLADSSSYLLCVLLSLVSG